MLLDKAFLRRFDRNILGKFSYLPSGIQTMKVRKENHLLVIDSQLPCDMFNIICCNGAIDLPPIRKSVEHFRSKKMPFAFWIGFEDEPSWLESELQRLGLVTDEMEWAMACDVSQHLEPCEYPNIRKISHREGIRDVVSIMKEIFPEHEHRAIESFYHQAEACLLSEDSKLVYLAGYEDAKPISLVSVYFDEGIASLFDLIVSPTMRGKGLGKLMTQRAMSEAKAQGFTQCILTATNDAKYLYQKLGFVDVKTMKVYHDPF